MTISTAVPNSTERIERIVNLVEHTWKLYPSLSFGQVLAKALGQNFDEGAMSDADVEATFREFLRRTFATSRDRT